MKKILLVDDHPLLREGLKRLIITDHNLVVCGMVATVEGAIALVESEQPDMVITDLTLPGRSGMDLIKELHASHPKTPLLVLSMHDENIYATRTVQAGGSGYIMKDTSPERLVEAIHTVLDGGVYLSDAVASLP